LIQSVLPLGLDRADTRFLALHHEERDTGRVIGVVATELLVVLGTGLAALTGMATYLGLTGGFDHDAGVALMVLTVTAPLAAMDAMVLNAFAVFAKPTAVFFRRYVLDPGLRLRGRHPVAEVERATWRSRLAGLTGQCSTRRCWHGCFGWWCVTSASVPLPLAGRRCSPSPCRCWPVR
jgi:hypothetical protein